MVTFSGGDIPVQRVVRRAYDVLKSSENLFVRLFPSGLLNLIIKAIVIAIFEEFANHNTLHSGMTDGIVDFDLTTPSGLDAVPFDKDV